MTNKTAGHSGDVLAASVGGLLSTRSGISSQRLSSDSEDVEEPQVASPPQVDTMVLSYGTFATETRRPFHSIRGQRWRHPFWTWKK